MKNIIKIIKWLKLYYDKFRPYLLRGKPYLRTTYTIVLIVLINLFISLFPQLKIDLTSNKVHTLSGETVKFIRQLDNNVKVTVFQSGELPPEIKPLTVNLKNTLLEFGRLNPARFKVIYLDPAADLKVREEAIKLGIQPLQFSILNADKYEVRNGYLGLKLEYSGKTEVLPVAGDVGNLEYFLVSSLKKISQKTTPIVLISEGREEESSEYKYFRQYLGQNYSVKDVDLNSLKAEDETAAILILLGSIEGVGENIEKYLDDWVSGGKSLMVFWNRVKITNAMQTEVVTSDGMNSFLKKNGMEVETGLVVDESASVANFKTARGSFLTEYPYWPQIKQENINREIPVLSGINTMSFEWISPIKISGLAQMLFESSQESRLDKEMANISPMGKINLSGETKKMVLGALKTKGAKIALVADADFIKDQFVTNNRDNMIFALNLVDYLSSDETLLNIRSKTISNSLIRDVKENEKRLIKGLNLAAPVISMSVLYFWFNWRRKKNNEIFN